MVDKGKFIISLDFELHWGGVEKWDEADKAQYFLNTVNFIPELLDIFKENSIRVTWATVGFLFAKDKNQLLKHKPSITPSYTNKLLDYYRILPKLGHDENDDPLHFAYSLITKILHTPGQDLGSHTFTHYYCNERGQSLEEFDADLKAAQTIAKENFGITLNTLVFPRNQFNKSYLKTAKDNGIKVIRTNPNVWFWNRILIKYFDSVSGLFRSLDTLLPISIRSLCFKNVLEYDGLVHLRASRFFRPYAKRENIIQKYKLNRIKREMTYAAKHNRNYHLWWHPHNFGNDIDNNKIQLLEIINHFNYLKDKYGFMSANMVDFIATKNA